MTQGPESATMVYLREIEKQRQDVWSMVEAHFSAAGR
jgi:hypothetical protein